MTRALDPPEPAGQAGVMARARIVPPATKGSRTASKDDVRTRVLKAALRLVEKQGVADLSMREVARLARVSHQAPYHHFPDRESILAALAEDGFTMLADRLESARDMEHSATERIVACAGAYVRFALERPSLFRLMFRPDFVSWDRFPSVRACGTRAFESLITAMQGLFDVGLPPEPSARAHVVCGWSLAHGLACLLLDGPLVAKVPEVAADAEAVIDETLTAMRLLLESRIAVAKTSVTSRELPARRRGRSAR